MGVSFSKGMHGPKSGRDHQGRRRARKPRRWFCVFRTLPRGAALFCTGVPRRFHFPYVGARVPVRAHPCRPFVSHPVEPVKMEVPVHGPVQ